MIRDTANGNLAPGAREVYVALQASKCVAQWRRVANGDTQYILPSFPASTPVSIKLVRQGNGFMMYCRAAAAGSWTALLAAPLTVTMSPQVLIGLAVSAENAPGGTASLTASFDNIVIDNSATVSGPALTAVEIGTTTGGLTLASNGNYTLYTKGSYAYFNADSMHYAYKTLSGDGDIQGLVTIMNGGAASAKAGLMIRDGVGAGAKNVFVAMQASLCLAQWRDTTGGGVAFNFPTIVGNIPTWLKLVRTGNQFKAYCKPGAASPVDNWIDLWPGAPKTVVMGSDVLIGLGVAAENAQASGVELAAGFSNLTFGVGVPAVTVTPAQSVLLAPGGATANFTVTSSAAWTAESRAQECPGPACWMTLGSPSSGSAGSGTVSYTVGNNPSWYSGRTAPVKVASGATVQYHMAMQKPHGNFTTMIVQEPADVTGATATLLIHMNDVPYALKRVAVAIAAPGAAAPGAGACYVTYSLTDTLFRLYDANWVTAGYGTALENRTLLSAACNLYLNTTTFVSAGAGSIAGTNNYRITLPLTLVNAAAGVKAVGVVLVAEENVSGTVVYHNREWETGYWR